MRSLIPLSTLPAFDAAAKHESFLAAAEELNLSQAAISRQIKNLEDQMGVVLFERSHRSVRLTRHGSELYKSVSVALRLIGETVSNIRPDKENHSVRIATDLALAHFWLIPRLDQFQSIGDGISISVTASDNEQDCLGPKVDLPILYGNGDWPGYDARPILDEEVYPVCNKEYLEKLGPVFEPHDLLKGDLLHTDAGPDNWVRWPEWMANFEVKVERDKPIMDFDSLPWSIQAAAEGKGIALGWKHLVDNLVTSGTLLRPIPHTVKTKRMYYMLFPRNLPLSGDVDEIYNKFTELVSMN